MKSPQVTTFLLLSASALCSLPEVSFAFSPSNNNKVASSASGWLQQQGLQQQHQYVQQPQSTTLSSTCLYQAKRKTTFVDEDDTTTNDDDICTIQILMSDTGGGHRASANALRDAFDVLYPGKIQCDIVDIYTDYGNVWPFNDYVNMYKLMAKYPITWDIFYHYGASQIGEKINDWLLEMTCFDSFQQCLSRPSCDTNKRADMVVSVHPLCQDLPLKILANLDSKGQSRNPAERKTPFATVVTDLGSAHPTWFNPGVDKCFVPSDALNEVARDRRLKRSQITQHGLPIRKGFWAMENGSQTKSQREQQSKQKQQQKVVSKKEKIVMRESLDLDPNLPTVLVVGGGDGMGGIVQIGQELGKRLGKQTTGDDGAPTTQMVIVCGNNKDAKEQLSAESFGEGVKVHVKGFVNNMDEWMKASDALVTKAGPGTIAEASICGLPCMLFSYLPGQEEGNIPFVEESGFGHYSGDPSVIANTVSSWLESPEKLESMQQSALEASRPMATLDIALDLANMVFEEKKKQKQGQKQKQPVKSRRRSPIPV